MVAISRSPKSESAKPTKLKIVAAIPCYNTERTIAGVVTKTKRYVDEVIVIDDGSTDKTIEVAKIAGARVLFSHSLNKGNCEAIKSCFESAANLNPVVLAIVDGDGQHGPDEFS